jgi:hypothetical protein
VNHSAGAATPIGRNEERPEARRQASADVVAATATYPARLQGVHYTYGVFYGGGKHTLTREKDGTRYVVAAVRILVAPSDPEDVAEVHKLQDAVQVEQTNTGQFEVPAWDPVSQKTVRDALLVLADTLPDKNRMFGARGEVEPIRRLLGAVSGWGENPDKDLTLLGNSSLTEHRLP